MKVFNLLSVYKFPLLISSTLAVVLIALQATANPLTIGLIVVGALVGTFILDFEYLVYAFIFEPSRNFSKTLVAFIRHADFANAAKHIEYHRHEVTDKSLNSALFQLVLAATMIFVVASNVNILVKALVLSVFASSLYRLAESYFENHLEDWFWTLKQIPSKQNVVAYSFGLVGVLIYCLYIF